MNTEKCWFCKGVFTPYHDEERTTILVDEYDTVARKIISKQRYIHVLCKEYALDFLRDVEKTQGEES